MTKLPKEYDWIRSSPIAHRGLHNEKEGRPENSLAAFDYACKKGFPIELDVRLAKDLEVVVIHDHDVVRLTGQPDKVDQLTSAELSQLHILNSDQHIPTLREVLGLVAGQVPILVEVKNEGRRVGGLEEQLLQLLVSYSGLVALQSFNPFSLRYIRLRAPNRIRGQLSGGFRGEQRNYLEKILLRNLLLNGLSRPHFIGYELEAFPSTIVSLYRRFGLPVLAWTIETEQQKDDSEKFADNFIFEGIMP